MLDWFTITVIIAVAITALFLLVNIYEWYVVASVMPTARVMAATPTAPVVSTGVSTTTAYGMIVASVFFFIVLVVVVILAIYNAVRTPTVTTITPTPLGTAVVQQTPVSPATTITTAPCVVPTPTTGTVTITPAVAPTKAATVITKS
jgi:hypothetical protein